MEELTPDQAYTELVRVNNELVNLQRELNRQNAELARLNQEKNRFVGMLAHDLRLPLSVIQTYSEFLMEELSPELDPQHLSFVETIQRNSQSMLALIEDLLDVSRIEAGTLELKLETVDVSRLVAQVLAQHRVLAARREVSLEHQAPESLPATLDPRKFEQVLNNLLQNAVKFSPPGSMVRLEVSPREEGLELRVSDSGPGIPLQEQSRIFQPFVSGAGRAGTGLGLAIVKRLVEGHGGRLRVESEPGRGASFVVVLPRLA